METSEKNHGATYIEEEGPKYYRPSDTRTSQVGGKNERESFERKRKKKGARKGKEVSGATSRKANWEGRGTRLRNKRPLEAARTGKPHDPEGERNILPGNSRGRA